MPDIPAVCRPLLSTFEGLEEELRDLQEELHHAAPQEKPGIVLQIKRLNQQVWAARDAYVSCLANNPLPPALASCLTNAQQHVDLGVRIQGVPIVERSYDSMPQFCVMFSPLRDIVTVTQYSVPPIIETGICYDVATVSMMGNATGSFYNHQITLPVTFQVTHTNIFYVVSNIALTLTTSGPGGQPVDGTGHVVLVGSGTLDGGALSGSPVSVTLQGSFDPIP
jgi:hypothetical protein